ncbi:Integrator complex subunit 11 [Borealophlyctis nickersoniae]|nr:Integrator complex subunit 11 [Borealophlyctis nickersoniae]
MSGGIKIVCLGAGQDVGRSCVLVTIGGKNIMFDCGMHMGYSDHRRFPDFSYISKTGDFTNMIDCVVISHFHLDHCGALPYFTEVCGYNGPIYMTYPTKAICPILLDDLRKIAVEKKGETNFFSADDVRNCMKKVIPLDLHQSVMVDDELELKPYYAGHVLGAAMFHARVGSETVVYTGDYNMTPDRHLGAAWIDKCRPDVLITETTYATMIRDSKRARERDFLTKVHDCVANGGKVLIPVFALGRAQELCILIESHWERMDLKVPVFFSAGLTSKANEYYKLFISWTNEKIKKTFVDRNMFDFNHIKPFDLTLSDQPGPMVLFASPGMLHSGTSLEVFKRWCGDPKNMVILPGYCVAGTVGAKVLAGEKSIDVDKLTRVQVNMQVENLSFSAHADAKGIIQLIRMCEPKHVMFVHGELHKMRILKQRVEKELKIECFHPANGVTINIPTVQQVQVAVSKNVMQKAYERAREDVLKKSMRPDGTIDIARLTPVQNMNVEGVVVYTPPKQTSKGKRDASTVLVDLAEAQAMGCKVHKTDVRFKIKRGFSPAQIGGDGGGMEQSVVNLRALKLVAETLCDRMEGVDVRVVRKGKMIRVGGYGGGGDESWTGKGGGRPGDGEGGVEVEPADSPECALVLRWGEMDEQLAVRALTIMHTVLK